MPVEALDLAHKARHMMSLTTISTSTAPLASDMSITLLQLPAEVRNLIYKFAFEQPQPVKLRSPSQRRLRASRPAREDARALLDTCQLIRAEAITLYYSLNALAFRSCEHALAFIEDPQIHPMIKSSITHVAVDFGDSTDADSILKDHISLVDICLGSLPRLKALETRFYARTLDACSSSHFNTLALAFDGLDADMNAPPASPRPPRTPRSPRSPRGSPRNSMCSRDASPVSMSSACSSPPPEPVRELQPPLDMSASQAAILEQYCFTSSAALAFAASKLKFSVAASSHSYPGSKHDKLICYNLRIGVDGIVNALGPAKEAVEQRIRRVGMLPRNMTDVYDTMMDGGFHQRVRATLASCTRIDVGVS